MSQVEDEGLLARWSRRKRQATLESQHDDLDSELQTLELASRETNQPIGVESESTCELDEVPVLTDADMPAIDTLDEESDFSGFMSSGVSDELRNLALRKLFSAPVFNIRDGLDEYDEDYTYFEKLGDIVTSDMKHQIELEEMVKKEQQSAEQSADEPADDSALIDEEGFAQGKSENEMEPGEKDTAESDSHKSVSEPERQESASPNSLESTREHHD